MISVGVGFSALTNHAEIDGGLSKRLAKWPHNI